MELQILSHLQQSPLNQVYTSFQVYILTVHKTLTADNLFKYKKKICSVTFKLFSDAGFFIRSKVVFKSSQERLCAKIYASETHFNHPE